MTATVDAPAEVEQHPGFSEAQINAIDRAVVRVYMRSRRLLPPHLFSERKSDPAAALRSVAYEYATAHPREIHDRTPGEVFHHVRSRLQQRVVRAVKARRERPYGIGEDFTRAIAPRAATDRLRVTQAPIPVDSGRNIDSLDRYGRILPPDQIPFMVKGRRENRPVWEDRAVIDRLHTRRPTHAEYWDGVLDGNSRRTARADLREDTGLHANTIAAIAEGVAPAVSERFSLSPRPMSDADVERERLRITSEEVRRVLLERFDVLYDD